MKALESDVTTLSGQVRPASEKPFFTPINQTSQTSGNLVARTAKVGGESFFPPRPQPIIQAKLQVNTPGDSYEQQADAVADQVMRMRDGDAPIVQRMPLKPMSGVMRMCSECAANQEEDKDIHRKESGSGDPGGHAAPPIVSQVLASGGGQAMDSDTRQFMETRFGQDFSAVRLHTDSRAAESAEAIQARAYTSGHNVVFGAGEYQPGSEGGKQLLAHELVHVGQQDRWNTVRRSPLFDFESARKTGISKHVELERILKTPSSPVPESRIASNFLMKLDMPSRIVTLDNLSFPLLEKLFTEVNFYPLNSIYYEKLEKNIASGLSPTAKQSISDRNKSKSDITGQVLSEKLVVWVNSFIPDNIPNTKKVNGGYIGTVFEGPPLTKCFATDNRSFSSSKSAKNRIRFQVLIDLNTFDIQEFGYSDTTYQVDCDDGTILCQKTAKGQYKVIKTREYGDVVEFLFEGKASDPCLPSPNLDIGGLIRVNKSVRRISCSLRTDPFPAFEMYANTTYQPAVKTLFQVSPKGNTYSLIGMPNSVINGTVEY
jgi:Domain of unknown function (DUF4157)